MVRVEGKKTDRFLGYPIEKKADLVVGTYNETKRTMVRDKGRKTD